MARIAEQACQKCGQNLTPHELYTHVCEDSWMPTDSMYSTQTAIRDECAAISEFLIAKNRKYGNSALQPIRVFSQATADEAMLVRMDDKLSRIKNQQANDDEDAVLDLIGYLILYRVGKRLEKLNATRS